MASNQTYLFSLILGIYLTWLFLFDRNAPFDQQVIVCPPMQQTRILCYCRNDTRPKDIAMPSSYTLLPGASNLPVASNDNRYSYTRQHGQYWILFNYVLSQRYFQNNESITYTTMGEYTFLDVIEEVIERWQAPISIALLACGRDFDETLNSIRYLRTCSRSAELIADFLTFHIFFEEDHMPDFVPKTMDQILQPFDCSRMAPFLVAKQQRNDFSTYRKQHKLVFPINLARNIARLEAHTYFVFPLDIELFPTINFVQEFFQLLNEWKPKNPRSVYVLPIFEIRTGFEIPENKTELQLMIQRNIAFGFHSSYAKKYHEIPQQDEWIAKKEPSKIEVFKIVKREIIGSWEPFYVTINKMELLYDERFTNEGLYDKNSQANLLSMLNYDFVLLDKTFLMHRPGIKTKMNTSAEELELHIKANEIAETKYIEQYRKLYVELVKEKEGEYGLIKNLIRLFSF